MSATSVDNFTAHSDADFARDLHCNTVISAFLFLLLLHGYTGAIDLLTWPALAGLIIMILGAPHGALDVAIASQRRRLITGYKIGLFLLQYVGLASMIAVAWWLAPGISLTAFLLVSAYHFGGDWMPSTRHGARVILGMSVLVATTVLHSAQVEMIFGWLAPQAQAATITKIMLVAAPMMIATAGLVIAKLAAVAAGRATEFVVVLFAAFLPPVTFFVTYFCLLHSVRHILHVRAELPLSSPRELVRAGWPYAMLAVLGSLAGAAAFRHIDLGPALLSSVFVTLAALTVPHIILIDCVPTVRGDI
jgi:beta-carotene 15,15'-dioxygenase